MKIVVTGINGYIGTLLASLLVRRGYEVLGIDTGFYRDGWLYNDGFEKSPACLNKDLRKISEEDLEGAETFIHLAELSNDPLGQFNPTITHQINHQGTVRLAEKCKKMGVKRFIYTSSCSVYGAGNDDIKTEDSPSNPQTAYAECKVLVERDVSQLASDNFSPTFLRNATAYGISPRIRFDIVLNNLAGLAWTTGEIKMISDGTPWRPLVHVRDICDAIVCVLESPVELVHNQIFNVGDDSENYRVREIAEIIANQFEGCKLTLGSNEGDNRSYRVSFKKINEMLGFHCQRRAIDGAREFYELFHRIQMTDDIFKFRAFTRLEQLKYLIGTKQIDETFYWRGL